MTKHQKGFTIIEVTLVIAIAGLIFTMIFIALPALQRNQRDTARRENLSEFITAVKKFQSNNRGALPSGVDILTVNDDGVASGTASGSEWPDFYNKYLGKTFDDPDGIHYKIEIVPCAGTTDASCNEPAYSFDKYTIVVITQATCNGETAKGTSNPRNLAATLRLEGSGTYCANT